MYTAVLMMTLSGGAEVPDFRRCNRCCRCSCACRCGSYHGCSHGCCNYGVGMPKRPQQGEQIKPPKKTNPEEVSVPTPASLVVMLPADARLLVDDHVTNGTSTRRQLITPPLEPGHDFVYVLTALAQRDGQTVSVSRNVVIRAGQQVEVSLTFASQGVAQQSSR